MATVGHWIHRVPSRLEKNREKLPWRNVHQYSWRWVGWRDRKFLVRIAQISRSERW